MTLLLIKKISELFIIMFFGFVLVKIRILKSSDSRVLSAVMLYLITPCVILNAFLVERTPELADALLFSFVAAIILNLFLIIISRLLKKPLRLDPSEELSIAYPNSANLIIPLIISMFGQKYVIFVIAYFSIQLLLMWSHGISVIGGAKKLNLKKLFANINLLAVFAGFIVFFAGIRLPAVIEGAVSSVAGTVGPLSMLVTGMLLGAVDFRKVFSSWRIYVIIALRLIALPLLVLAIIKLTGAAGIRPDAKELLLISFIAVCAPPAATVTQIEQVYGDGGVYAGAINAAATLICPVTMSLLVALYQAL